ncbi:MAG: hypothetical protein A2286_01460 [Gammaproteobacteria bacterium RIFOXYA12_FULL_61_12]|nr:MAG: hypothetical protein A2286_01460 [Gammaproteobacteria bacterium RIFOXYA12_FULL_61_12]OGT91644.1 MAG: hypothetical protein A2514_05085 [Gammaproteobacteria bacterium RIFOXYD12_FULL_61_37]
MRKDKVSGAVAAEAARILAESGGLDFASARRKAAKRLGIGDRKSLPDNLCIEAALREYQALFLTHRQPEALRQSREWAARIMRTLHAFSPRLTGVVLDGSADWRSPLEIHLFADCCEDVLLELMGQHVRWNNEDRLVVYPDGAHERRPLFRIQHGDMEVELICFPSGELKNRIPLNPLDGRPMRRARLAELEKELRES